MNFTVPGGRGFVGCHLVAQLRRDGHEVVIPGRTDLPEPDRDYGHVFYAIGMTGDFRHRLGETVDAHVNVLRSWLAARHDSFLYLSSTRPYGGLAIDQLATEDMKLPILPCADTIYDLSKLLGEALCLSLPSPTVRIARLANVYGQTQHEDNFLGSVLRQIARTGSVKIGEAPSSSKDYIAVHDVVRLLPSIASAGRQRMYNIASGKPVCHADLAESLRQLGNTVEFGDGPERIFPTIDTTRITNEFGFTPRGLLDDLPALLYSFQNDNRDQ